MAEGTNVVIDEETFAIDTKPATSSALVKKAKQDVLGEIDLDLLTQSLSRVGKFIRLAYNGVNGDTANQIKVQRVEIRITKLSDHSALMVHRYGNVARDVLAELQASYRYLFDGMEEIALDAIFQIATMAKQMADQTKDLCNSFELIHKEIIDVFKSTQKKKGEDIKMKKKLDEERQKAEQNIKRYQELKKDAKEAYDKAQLYFYEAQAQDENAIFDLSSIFNAALNLTNTIALMGSAAKKGGFMVVGMDASAKQMDPGARVTAKPPSPKVFVEEQTKYVNQMKQQRDIERKALSSFEDSTSKIANYRQIDDEKLENAATLALHCAIGAITHIVVVLKNATKFWRHIQDHCATLRTEAAQEKVKAMVNDNTKRMFSNAFKQQAVKYYSQWVALESVCTQYTDDIKTTRAELQQYMKENPTIEESRKALPKLAQSLAKDLSEANAALDEKDRQAEEEMKKLKLNN